MATVSVITGRSNKSSSWFDLSLDTLIGASSRTWQLWRSQNKYRRYQEAEYDMYPMDLRRLGRSDAESIATIHRALDLGINFFDASDQYGPYINEELVGPALRNRRDAAVIATKFGIVRGSDPATRSVSGKPEYVRKACDASLKRLGVDRIDLYYQHRVDPDTPIAQTVGAMARLVEEGKVRYLGLSETAPETPAASVQDSSDSRFAD